ncbi:MAG: trigger factor [Chitinophagales bacterium]
MQVNKEILENGLGLIKLTIEPGDYQEAVNNELKNLRKKAQIKGFRAGMVPMGVVKKMFGKSVFAEQLNKVLEEQLNNFLKETEWEILANPVMMDNDMDKMDVDGDKNYTFDFEVALKPSIEIPLLNDSDTVFDNYQIEVADDLLDEEISRLQKQYGTSEEVENDIDESDSLEVSFVELDAEGNVKEEGVENTTWIAVDMLKEEGPRESVLALKKGDSIDIDIFEAFDREDNQISSVLLDLDVDDDGDFIETSGKFRMTIKTVKRLKKAAIDKELFMKVFGLEDDTVLESEDEETAVVNSESLVPEIVTPEFFREKIKESLARQYDDQTSSRLWLRLREHIVATTQVDLAEKSIRSMWFFNNKDEKIEDKESAFADYFNDLKWRVILEDLAKHFEIEIDNNLIISETIKEVSSMFRMYMGGQGIPDDFLKQLVESRLQDEEYVRNMSAKVIEKQVALKLRETVSLNTIGLSVDEYNDLLKKDNEVESVDENSSIEEAVVENKETEDTVVVAEEES